MLSFYLMVVNKNGSIQLVAIMSDRVAARLDDDTSVLVRRIDLD